MYVIYGSFFWDSLEKAQKTLCTALSPAVSAQSLQNIQRRAVKIYVCRFCSEICSNTRNYKLEYV